MRFEGTEIARPLLLPATLNDRLESKKVILVASRCRYLFFFFLPHFARPAA